MRDAFHRPDPVDPDLAPTPSAYGAPMRAVVCSGYGPPDRLKIREVEQPRPGPGDVLVRVHATTVNRTDHATARGVPKLARIVTGLTRPRQSVLGTEFAGTIEEVGADVTEFSVGDAVFGFHVGTQAEYVTVPASGALATIPSGMTAADVAPTTEGAHYALSGLETVDVGPGDHVLVYGASGAIGTAVVQLLKHRGVTVTAVCGPDGTDLLASLGADDVVDRTTEDFTRTDRRFAVVFDAVGETRFVRCRSLLEPGGAYLTTDLGPRAENVPLIVLTRWIGDHRVRLPVPTDARGHVRAIRDLLAGGDLRPVVDRTYALDDIVDAYRFVGTGRKLGNVVVTVP
jgi:NADPH:quinone reductase-like Zn-dependent oxidoreductase